jgi:hypothetical protein
MDLGLPIVNRKYYTNEGYNDFYSILGKSDWFECNWIAIPVSKDPKDFKRKKFHSRIAYFA